MTGFEWGQGVGSRTQVASGIFGPIGRECQLIHWTLLDVVQVINGGTIVERPDGLFVEGGTTIGQIETDGEDLDAVLGRHGYTPTTPVETPDGFTWHTGIPSRNRFAYGHVGDVPVKVNHLTVLRLLLIEEIGGDRMPVRTLSSIDVPPGVDVDGLLSTLKIVPA